MNGQLYAVVVLSQGESSLVRKLFCSEHKNLISDLWNLFFVEFEVLTAVVMKSPIFWDVTLCSRTTQHCIPDDSTPHNLIKADVLFMTTYMSYMAPVNKNMPFWFGCGSPEALAASQILTVSLSLMHQLPALDHSYCSRTGDLPWKWEYTNFW
jgi:hypothetical protein